MTPTNLMIVKLSSLGDVVHAYQALQDFKQHFPKVPITWMVEEAFASIVAENPNIDEVIAIPLRRLQKKRKFWWRDVAWKSFRSQLSLHHCSHAIDAQGLIKSALLMLLVDSPIKIGADKFSAKESLARIFYNKKISVKQDQHAIYRIRELFAKAFSYEFDRQDLSTGLPQWHGQESKQLIFFHGTTWKSKKLPVSIWQQVIAKANDAGFEVLLPFSNEQESQIAHHLAENALNAKVLPKTSLSELQKKMRHLRGAISVDTGLGHLAAAIEMPVLGIYGPTSSEQTGMLGVRSHNLSLANPCCRKNCQKHGADSPQGCMSKWSAEQIWEAFCKLLEMP